MGCLKVACPHFSNDIFKAEGRLWFMNLITLLQKIY